MRRENAAGLKEGDDISGLANSDGIKQELGYHITADLTKVEPSVR